jgi:hypothetical protein
MYRIEKGQMQKSIYGEFIFEKYFSYMKERIFTNFELFEVPINYTVCLKFHDKDSGQFAKSIIMEP